MDPWVLELGARGGFDRGLKEKNGLGLIIKRENTKSHPRDRLEPAFDGGGVATGAVGLPTSVLMEIPE